MNKKYLQELIDASYALDDDTMDFVALTSERDTEVDFDKEREALQRRQDALTSKFKDLADALYKAGAFRTKEEARSLISIDSETRQSVLGPGGVVPDDGALKAEEEVDGLLALLQGGGYFFRVPVAYNLHGEGTIAGWSSTNCEVTICAGPPPDLYSHPLGHENQPCATTANACDFIWVHGAFFKGNYPWVKQLVEIMCLEIQGAMLALGFAKFWGTKLVSPPPMEIGSGQFVNRGVYTNSVVSSMAFGIRFHPKFDPEGELDQRLGSEGAVKRRTRQLERLFSSTETRAQEVRQALRMYLRAHAAWSEGEKAMFLGTMLEGLLLDRRKDDLSARLQDAVAFWIGSSAEERTGIRKDIRDLYSARSDFVHNGELSPRGFREEIFMHHAKKVILKEIDSL